MNSSLFRLMGLCIVLLAAVGFAAIGGYMGMFLSGCMSCLFIYIVVMSIWINRGDVHAERIFHQQGIQAGDQVEVTITITMPSRYWLVWIIVEERWVRDTGMTKVLENESITQNQQLTGNHPTTQKQQLNQKQPKQPTQKLAQIPEESGEFYACLAYIRGDQHISCHYTASAKSRGVYHVHSSRVVIGDMFGLVRKVLTQEERDAELVQVNPVPLQGNWISQIHDRAGDPADYSTLRDYIDGDPLSNIDWKSYARYQKLKTKQRDVEHHTSMWIVMDAREANFETIVSATTRMILEINDPNIEICLACGDHLCAVSSQYGISTEVYSWLSSLAPSVKLNFSEQLRRIVNRSEFSHLNSRIIGLTTSTTGQIAQDQQLYYDNHSIQLLYIPLNVEPPRERDGEMNYA